MEPGPTPQRLRVEERPPSRRSFVKYAIAAGIGAAAPTPALRVDPAFAAGEALAYTDAENVFTMDQRVDARLGVGTDPEFPLHVRRVDNPGWAAKIESDTVGLVIGQTRDLSAIDSAPYDVIDLFLRSTGDGIFAHHGGGVVPNFTFTGATTEGSPTLSAVSSFAGLTRGTPISGEGILPNTTVVSTNRSAGTLEMSAAATATQGEATFSVSRPAGVSGGNAIFNALIPYHLDGYGTGRDGSIQNNRTGMVGLKLETQAPGSHAINVDHAGDGPSVFIRTQNPEYPQGGGGAIGIVDYSPSASIDILKGKTPTGGRPILRIGGPVSTPMDAIRVNDSSGNGRILMRTDGTAAFGLDYPFRNPHGAKLEVHSAGAGIVRNVALTNYQPTTPGFGTQIDFSMGGNQWAQIQAVMDSSSPPNSSLRLRVRDSSFRMVERLRVDGVGLGFFGSTPVARPTVRGSRDGNDALRQLLTALASLGLITDSTGNS